MTGRSRKRAVSVFHVLLMVASTTFVVTALAYAIGPEVVRRAQTETAPGSAPRIPALVFWLDRWAPALLTIEFGVMLVLGLLSMITEHGFGSGQVGRTRPTH